ncbi:MAG: 2-polyprenyl-3-methyl-6-methoxy-1,4-benzoquinone monooxygenase [Steroidobacteraceae bacterium]
MSLDRLLEPLLATADNALRSVLAEHRSARPTPGASATTDQGSRLPEPQRRHVAGLMRVNHSGEVAAQALYQGQAAFARNPRTREMLLRAGREETDHLAWCEQRLRELDSRPSLLAPLWYAGSFALGAAAAAFGDRISLGFVAETERQVEGHLESHLERLPVDDTRSRAILAQMKQDEMEHGDAALAAGGGELPTPVREAMRATARVMTFTSYWV